MAASVSALANIIPTWAQIDDQGQVIKVDQNLSHPATEQITRVIQMIVMIIPQCSFGSDDSLNAIF